MDTLTFTDPVALLRSVEIHIMSKKDAKVELHDDPENRKLGYKTADGKISWVISITDLKRTLADPARKDLAKDLAQLFKTPEGRVKILTGW
jgi:hypothetical protein